MRIPEQIRHICIIGYTQVVGKSIQKQLFDSYGKYIVLTILLLERGTVLSVYGLLL